MTNHKLTGNQIQCIFILFWMGSVVLSGGSREAKQDYWASVLIAALLYSPVLAVYVRISSLYPGLNLFEIIFKIFGKFMGRVITLFFFFYGIYLGAMSIHTIAAYVQLVNLPETPTIAIAAAIILVCCLCVINGPEVMGRIAKSLAFIFVTFSFFTIAIGLKDMRFSNLLPVLTTGIKPLMNAAFSMYTLPLAEGILCLSLFSSVEENISVKKVILKAFFVSLATFLSISLRNILILGVPASQEFYFPSYDAIRVLSIGDFFTRFEVFIGINLLLAGIIKIGVCLYASSLGLTKILSLKSQRSLVVPCALLIVTVSQNLYANIQRMVEFIQVYKYFALPFETLLPAMILIGAEIQMRWKSGGTKKADPSAPQTEQ